MLTENEPKGIFGACTVTAEQWLEILRPKCMKKCKQFKNGYSI